MRRPLAGLALLLLLASCGEKEPAYQGAPAIRLTAVEVGRTTLTVQVESLHTEGVWLWCTTESATPDAATVLSRGEAVSGNRHSFTGLVPGTRHIVFGVGKRADGVTSKVESLEVTTGVLAGDLYPWEKGRGVPFLPDLTLCTGGGAPNSNAWFTVPRIWDKARFAPHVSYSDDEGEHWLFQSFLAITGVDMDGNNYGISNNGKLSANKDSWDMLATYWLQKGGAFDALDQAIGEAAARIGNAPGKRYVVMMLPDPVMFHRYSDKTSSTTYWGALDGLILDFARIDDQIKALEWYIERVRSLFATLAPKYLELAGFYILSEELVAESTGYNYAYKRWDRILPPVAEYLHQRNEGLYWIPYLGADGCTLWRELGIDQAWLQPNYYWDYNHEKPIREAFRQMIALGMGMELEFEYSMVAEVMGTPGIMGPDAAGRFVFQEKDVPLLRARFKEYMDGFRETGLYGTAPVALYSGSNALYQLGTSQNEEDKALYLELCRFISLNPLRK